MKNYTLDDFACRCGCGTNKIDPAFAELVDAAVEDLLLCRFPKPAITSGYRCPAHNLDVSHTGADGPHTTGKAVDLAIDRAAALSMVYIAVRRGFTGLGVSQKGDHRFLHLDKLTTAEGFPRPTIWSY